MCPSPHLEPHPPVIVLHQPQLGENIGMCARAMLNCGLTQLRLVAPREPWPNPAAIATAADADVVLQGTEVFDSFAEAIGDCTRVLATSARSRHVALPHRNIFEAVDECRRLGSQQKPAFVFGPEASGLPNEVLQHVDCLVQFPTNPEFSSLNLAQAVLLLAWEWVRSPDSSNSSPRPSSTPTPAPKQELQNLLLRLEGLLDSADFFLSEERRPGVMNKLSTFIQRAHPSENEINLLHGALTALNQGTITQKDSGKKTEG